MLLCVILDKNQEDGQEYDNVDDDEENKDVEILSYDDDDNNNFENDITIQQNDDVYFKQVIMIMITI